ncbi:hypothetical protein CL619_00225 [archaeon]|nr:hypothetical protein [archaeon]|tara:strand:- start:735 stop:1439 length:705 start_codon:yes stop_codon:yes gene_type:complete
MTERKIKAILSDAGGILFDDRPYKVKEYLFVRDFMDVSYREFMDEFHLLRNKAQQIEGYSKVDALKEYLDIHDLSEHFPKYAAYAAEYDAKHFGKPEQLVKDGVIKTLQGLQEEGIDFIVLTDSTRPLSQHRSEVFDPAGLSPYITAFYSSKELGVKKPAAEFFQYVLDEKQLSPDEVLWVAHDLDEIIGGYEFGFVVAAVNYNPDLEESGELDQIKDNGYLLNHFRDLLTLVE